jgi:hypothetical protein
MRRKRITKGLQITKFLPPSLAGAVLKALHDKNLALHDGNVIHRTICDLQIKVAED